DEQLTVDLGDDLLSNKASWLLRVVGMVPTGNWDQYAMRGTVDPIFQQYQSKALWPLFTLRDDSDNSHYIEVLADCQNYGLLVRVKNGTTLQEFALASGLKHVWLPDSPAYFVIGFNYSTQQLVFGLSLGGDLVDAVTSAVSMNAESVFNKLEFRGADGEVCEMRWIGGDANNVPDPAPTMDSVKTVFSSL